MPLPKKLYFGLLTAVVFILGVIYYKFNPSEYSFFPKCPFLILTGLDCPGCGSQRAINSLLHGEILRAAKYNFLLLLSLPFLLVHFGFKLTSAVTKKDLKWALLYHPLTPWVIFVFVMLFWILRNVPQYPFNYLSAGH